VKELPSRAQIARAAEIVHAVVPPTPQYRWPLLCERLGTEIWVKHENHTPTGAFKLRGGLVYFDDLAARGIRPAGVISATRGNHGQSVAFAARQLGLPVTIVVPHGNSVEKNAAMRALGAELVEHGDDFQASLEHARELADEGGLRMVPSFHPLLIRGVATYSMELFSAVDAIDITYVPIGLGSGICGMLAARAALGARTEIVGVVSAHATAYADSYSTHALVERPVTTVLADGMACRTPVAEALELIWQGVDRVVQVTDDEIAAAMRMLYETTHNVSEGAGAAATAAAFQERNQLAEKRVAVVLSGGNVDRDMFAEVLGNEGG